MPDSSLSGRLRSAHAPADNADAGQSSPQKPRRWLRDGAGKGGRLRGRVFGCVRTGALNEEALRCPASLADLRDELAKPIRRAGEELGRLRRGQLNQEQVPGSTDAGEYLRQRQPARGSKVVRVEQ